MTDRLYTTTTQIEKARKLWEQAVLLADRTTDFYTTKLYHLHNGYLEVVWHNHFNIVVKVSRFTDTDRLAPYLEAISIDELFI